MTTSPHIWATLGIGLGIIGLARPAEAGLTTYTSQPSFLTATSGLTNLNFNGQVASPTSYNNYIIPTGYTDASTGTNFTYTNSAGDDINITGRSYYGTNFFSDDTLNQSQGVSNNASEVITLTKSVRAFSMLFSAEPGTPPVTFTLSNGDSYTDSSFPAFGTVAFLGFTDTTPFTSITISSPQLFLLGVAYGNAVPEPSSLTLAAIPLAVLAARAGWRRRALAH